MKYSTLIFDLDGTLAPSKDKPSKLMANTLCKAQQFFQIAVISGASFTQFQKQLVSHLPCSNLSKVLLAPTNGSAIYIFKGKKWICLEKQMLSEKDKKNISDVIVSAMKKFNIPLDNTYGPQIEDRETQVTFSGCGRLAPISKKETWDPDASLRKKMSRYMKKELPNFEIKIGGMTSIDITGKGFDKGSAIERIMKYLNIKNSEILFVGDALFKGGNDEPAKRTGVDTKQVKDPKETQKLIADLIKKKNKFNKIFFSPANV